MESLLEVKMLTAKKEQFDVAIIGGGIVGTALFSELSRCGVNVVLLEASDDVSNGSTKANSGIIHSGYDPIPGTLMARFNLEGSKMYPSMCARLGVTFNQCGTLTVSNENGRQKLQELLQRGVANGVEGLKIVESEELHALEPNLVPEVTVGLFAPTGAIVSPYNVCVALAEEGIVNGGTAYCYFKVNKIKQTNQGFVVYSADNYAPLKDITAKYVVNCAGANAIEINNLLNITPLPDVSYVKGEYILLDKSQQGYIRRPIFPLPTKMGKGIVANVTVHGNILFGPTATPCDKDDTSVSSNSVSQIMQQVSLTVKKPNFNKTIKLFAGVRAKVGKDFVIQKDDQHPGYYYTLGICSPGLTSAPAIAVYLKEMLVSDGLKTKNIKPKRRKPYVDTTTMTKQELDALIKSNPEYGKIVCKCENVSEGEILDVLHSPLHPTSIDAIKRRVRPSMGRCQGSYCIPKLINILSTQLHIPKEQVTLHGYGSELLTGDIKQYGYYAKKQINKLIKQSKK